MKQRKIAGISSILLFGLVSCGPLVKNIDSKVSIQQVQEKKVKIRQDTINQNHIYSAKTEKDLKSKYTAYEKDVSGEDIMSLELADVTIVAKSKNIPERAGKIKLDFKVSVPNTLINKKWQVQLTPCAYKNNKRIEFDKIFISGADFLRQQKKGYQMYQNFIASIIPDSAYMQSFFNEQGYQKAISKVEESFYISWKKNELSEARFVDWRNVNNRRTLLFNGVMERNRSSIGSGDWKSHLPAYYMERESDLNDWKSHLNSLEQKAITVSDSIEISKRFFDYKRMADNERRKAIREQKYNQYVLFPTEPCRLDTVIEVGNNFEYYYSQSIEADEAIKKIDVTINGEIIAVDNSRAKLPQTDTITYYISSMVQFLDHSPRFKRIIINRHAQANTTCLINFKVGRVDFDERIGNNKEEITRVLETLHKLTFTGELVLDSVHMIATSSPEGDFKTNLQLSKDRAQSLKEYLRQKVDADEISLFKPSAIGEDWTKLLSFIKNDESIKDKDRILSSLSSYTDKEQALKNFPEYKYIRDKYYPLLRAVNFDFFLHRREMVKDTIHTTVIDTAYMDAIKMMENRQYRQALQVLDEYSDHNTAVCLMSLGFDARAITIFESLPPTADVSYLLSILYVRSNRIAEAIDRFKKACHLDSSKWYRGLLDPEINKIIVDHKLNFEYEN